MLECFDEREEDYIFYLFFSKYRIHNKIELKDNLRQRKRCLNINVAEALI